MSNVIRPRTRNQYYKAQQYVEEPLSGEPAHQIDQINPTLTPMPWLQTAHGMRGAQPHIDLAPEESRIKPSAFTRVKPRTLSRHLGLAHNDSNAREIYLYDANTIAGKYTAQECDDWEHNQNMAEKFADELQNDPDTGDGVSVAAANSWNSWRSAACLGSTQHNATTDFQEAVILFNNMMYNQYGGSWWPNGKDGKPNDGVPHLIQAWIAAKADPQDYAIAYMDQWVLYMAISAKNAILGEAQQGPQDGLIGVNSFEIYFGSDSVIMQATASSLSKYPGDLVNIVFDVNVLAANLVNAWNQLKAVNLSFCTQLATDAVSASAAKQFNPSGVKLQNISPSASLINPANLSSATVTGEPVKSDYNWQSLQDVAGIMLRYAVNIWYQFCIDTAYNVTPPKTPPTPPAGGGTEQSTQCTAMQAANITCTPGLQCVQSVSDPSQTWCAASYDVCPITHQPPPAGEDCMGNPINSGGGGSSGGGGYAPITCPLPNTIYDDSLQQCVCVSGYTNVPGSGGTLACVQIPPSPPPDNNNVPNTNNDEELVVGVLGFLGVLGLAYGFYSYYQ